MKTGKTLTDLAAEILRQSQSKRDFVAPTEKLAVEAVMDPNDESPQVSAEYDLTMENGNGGFRFGMRPLFHEQVATKLGIPQRYYERMQAEAPGLLTANVNHWLQTAHDRVMVRTLDGEARAFLSDRYRPLDNFDLAETILPRILEHQWEIKSCEITERRLYLKVVSQQVTAKVRLLNRHGAAGLAEHVVHPGVTISNSEVGLGAIRFEPTVHHEHCLNIVVLNGAGIRKVHLGKGGDFGFEGAEEFYSTETRKLDDRAFWAKMKDILDATLTEEVFLSMVERFTTAQEYRIVGDPVKVIEEVTKRYALTEGERGDVLRNLITEGDLSAYGLMNAITGASAQAGDYDRATELERLGGKILELPRQEWEALASVR